ncbi:MAG TPA: hypothetical protein DHW80_09385, partial [Acinetobacter sp.]|nr:hypothetical protein [Acinetobacter sp.]
MLHQIKLPFLFSTLLCIAFTQNACAKPQTDSSSKSSYQSFIPKNWKVLEKTQCDLNQDGQADLALIIEDTNPENLVANAGVGNHVLNTNKRKLLILFK